MASPHYVIRGGVEGRERLRLLARVMRPATLDLFERVGIPPGANCLDVACGGGDVTCDLARLVGPQGRVLGIDLDEAKLELARREAEAGQVSNVAFQPHTVGSGQPIGDFDVAYCRFLLSHLRNPIDAVLEIRSALRPGGVLMLVDVDFSGYFWYPESRAQSRYYELYTEAVKRRGGDPNIGPRLPSLLKEAGFENIRINVVQPAGLEGDVKLITALTMENIAEALITDGVASAGEIQEVVTDLYEFARAEDSIGTIPRIVEAWGTRPD